MHHLLHCSENKKKLKNFVIISQFFLFLINIFKEKGKERVLRVPVLEAASMGVAVGKDCTPRPCPDDLPDTKEPEPSKLKMKNAK